MLIWRVHSAVNFPVNQTPSGGVVFTLQRREEGQMQREAGEGSREGEMLTFSREQQCIEAAVAVASLPPSPLCISLSLPSSLSQFFSCSLCRMTGIKSWLLIKTTHPASMPAILSTCSLHPFSLLRAPSFSRYFFSLYFFSCSPYFATPLPCCSSSLRLSLHSPCISYELPFFHFFFCYFSLHPSSSLPPSFSPISSPLLSPPLFTSTPTSKQQKYESMRNREKKRARHREVVVSRLRQSCHQLRDLRVCVCGSVSCQFTLRSLIKGKSRHIDVYTHTYRHHNHPTRGSPSARVPLVSG